MTLRAAAVRHADALRALATAIDAAKGGHPLTPVTVIVPTNAVGVAARRWLGGSGGVAAIELVTLQRLAERLAGASLAAAGRLPTSTPLIDLAVREVLHQTPGDFGRVARHPSTVTSLRDLHREVRFAGPAALSALRGGARRAAEAGRVSAMVAERLADDWFDEADLLTAAIDTVIGGADLFPSAVAFLPRPERGLAADLLGAIGGRTDVDVDVIVEWCDVPTVDAETQAFVAAIGATVAPPAATPPPTDAGPAPARTLVVSTTDADEEVRDSVRRIVAAARDGIAFARIALVWPTDRPYARLVEHHLDAAGIPWNGRPGTLVTERLVPRFLLDLLDLDRRGLRRNELFAFLSDVPVHTSDGRRVSVARWERIARAAGISRDEHWRPRLERFADRLRARAGDGEPGDGDTPRDREIDEAERLAAFVDDLRRDLGDRRRIRTWSAWAEWCERQVAYRLGSSVLDQLDEAERLASDHASRVLDRLHHLDTVSRPVDRGEFRAAFAAEFDVAPGRLGRLGDGVTIGSLAGTVGLGADLTIVLGAAEGILPPPPPTDPLISDADRRGAGLATSDARAHRIHRSFLSHLANSESVVVHSPRGDLRATTDRLPSRWIAAHLSGTAVESVSSHHAGLVACEFPAAVYEHRLRERAVAARTGELAESCVGDTAAERGLRLRAARRSDRITEFDGDLTSVAIDHFPRPVSASQIEAWRPCPHAYFVRYLLGVRPLDDPADELGLSPIEQGNVIHETLDRFHQLVIAGEVPQPGAEGWSPTATAALLRLYDETADDFERSGRTGRAANWLLDRGSVRNELVNWFVHDGRTAAARGARVEHSELAFGRDGDVSLPLADGRELAVYGFADRIDRTGTGELIIVDHKTGKPDGFKKIERTNPTDDRTRFQLPVYAAAALATLGERVGERGDGGSTPVRAEYGFFDRGGYERYGYRFDDEVWATVADDLLHVVSGIESGLFPSVTEPPKWEYHPACWYCQPDGLGVDERYAEWSAKRDDPRIARWFAPDPDESAGDTAAAPAGDS